MNSKLYVPDPNQWIRYFEKKPSDSLKVDSSTIKLTSPVQSVVQRAKSELERINSDTDVKPIITSSTAMKNRSKRIKTLKQKTRKTANFTSKKRKYNKKSKVKISKKTGNKNRNKNSTIRKVVHKDIFS